MATDAPSPASGQNPLLVGGGLPDFSAVEPHHVGPAVERLCKALVEGVERLEQEAPATWEGLVAPLNDLEEPLSRGWGVVEHLMRVKNSDELRKAHGEAQGRVVEATMRVAQSRALYDKLKALQTGPGFALLGRGQQRAVERRLLSAELAGVALDGEARGRFEAIEKELEELSTHFANHVLDATKAWSKTLTDPADVEGLPPTFLELAASAARAAGSESATAERGPWRVTLDFPSFGPFLRHCRRRELREEAYRAYVTRASSGELDNSTLIDRILTLRREKAHLLGKASFAEVSLAAKMADGPADVRRLLDELCEKSEPAARAEHDALRALADAEDLGVPADDLKNWDIEYLAEHLRERTFDLRDEDTRPFLPLGRVLEGLFRLARDLFGVEVTAASGKAPVWHKDVMFFEVKDAQSGQDLAAFYLDPYTRPADKRGGAWMDECRSRRLTDHGVQRPVAYLVCNQTPPTEDRPSLMSFREVETLFHEFGHGLQHMLTEVDHLDVAGINGVEWDAVELPSQFMENWCFERDVLLGMSGHFETGAPMPDELFDKIRAARTFRAASAMMRQIYYARLDLELHHEHDPAGNESVLDVQHRIAAATLVVPPLPEDRFLCGFTHIFAGGYAAGYYSYKWAEVLAADAFGAFADAGLDDDDARHRLGRLFRHTILGEGGSRHPLEVFETFRGRAPETDALLRQSGLL